MSLAAHSVALATCSLLAPGDWNVAHDRYGIVEVINARPSCLSSIKVWSLLNQPDDVAEDADKLQVEVVSTLPWLEQRLTEAFGNVFSNEQGKTISVHLHRLLPDGRKHAGGFLLSRNPGPDSFSPDQLASQISVYGAPFLERVSSGAAFDDESFLPPTLLDPVNWSVRRAMALVALGRRASARDVLLEVAPRVQQDLEAKWSTIAAASRSVNAKREVHSNMQRFITAIEALRNDA